VTAPQAGARRVNAPGPLLDIRNLEVHYRTVGGLSRAVDGVNLTLERGEILGLAGESGCGKSTLTTAVLRLTRPPAYLGGGEVLFAPAGGQPVNLLKLKDDRLRDVRWRHLAYIPQGSMNSLNPVMRVRDQFVDVMMEHAPLSRAQARERVPELLHQVGLGPHVAGMFPFELSGGMKQRAIIAMAIALDSDLVIADEPTTALDVNVQRVIIQTLAELRDRLGMSLIVVTHDMAVHAQLADRVAVMYAGQIVEHAGAREVFKTPRHPYAQGLISAIPMIGGAHLRLAGIEGIAPSPLAWPPGCRFHPRCPYAMPVCREVAPELLPLEPGREGPYGSGGAPGSAAANGAAAPIAGHTLASGGDPAAPAAVALAPAEVHVACHLYREPPPGAANGAGAANGSARPAGEESAHGETSHAG
jgi:peptide/nickel transport system ATP-binding protein